MRHIDAVVTANKDAGGTFFDKRTVCYFKNKVLPTLYGGKYFISYDIIDGEKRFTVRKVLSNGLVGKAGDLHAYASKSAARDAIRELLASAVVA